MNHVLVIPGDRLKHPRASPAELTRGYWLLISAYLSRGLAISKPKARGDRSTALSPFISIKTFQG